MFNPNVLPCGIIYGLKLVYVSASQVRIKQGFAYSDDGGRMPLEATEDIIADITTDLDTGSEEADVWYYLFLIKNIHANDVKPLFSKSINTPVLPEGYSIKRRIGVVRNNLSSDFYKFIQCGNNAERIYWYDEDKYGFIVLSQGGATSPTAVDLTEYVPESAEEVYFSAEFAVTSQGVDTNFLRIRPTGSSASTPLWRIRPARETDRKTYWQTRVPLYSQSVDYWCSSSYNSATLIVQGFIEHL